MTVALVTEALPSLTSLHNMLQALLSYQCLERFKIPISKPLWNKKQDNLKAKLIGVSRGAVGRVRFL